MTRPTKFKFGLIELGRGIAASLVVFYHAANIMSQPRFFGTRPFGGLFLNFNVGVDFFFVLSGFIIAWIHWDDIGRPGRIRDFASKRFLRIYPPYWGVLFPLVALYLLFPAAGQSSQHDPLNILLSIGLLPNRVEPVLGVAWTLTHEIFFYLLFGLIIVGGRRWLWALPLWAVAILAAHLLAPLPFPASFFLSPFNLEFILGVGAAMLLRRQTVQAAATLLAAGAVIFVGFLVGAPHIQDDPLVGRLAFGIPATLFVIGAVEVERRGRIALPPALAFLGASSYAVYLVHSVTLSLVVRFLARASGILTPSLALPVLAVIAIAAGMLYHAFAEPRLVAAARRLVGGPRPDAAPIRTIAPTGDNPPAAAPGQKERA